MKKGQQTNKSKTPIIIVIMLLLLIILIVLGVIFIKPTTKTTNKNKKPEIKYNTNEEVIKDKEINGILFTDIKCSYDGENSILTYKIVNNTTQAINLKEYEIIVKNKEGNVIAMIEPNLDKEIQPGESFETGNAINIDLSDAESMELNLDQTNE